MDILFIGNWMPKSFVDSWLKEHSTLSRAINVVSVTDILQSDDESYADRIPAACVSSIHTDASEVSKDLVRYSVVSLPWRVVCDATGAVVESCAFESAVPDVKDDCSQLFSSGIAASNDGRYIRAVECFQCVLNATPDHCDALFNMSSILHMHGFPILSIAFVEKLLLRNPDDMISNAFLWALAQSDDTRPACVVTYRRLAAAGSVVARHKLAALTGEGYCTSVDPEYARRIFDDMAPVFEQRLVEDLGYTCPWTMREMLHSFGALGGMPRGNNTNYSRDSNNIPPCGGWRVLDLGCGSGLCGRAFGEISSPSCTAQGTSTTLLEASRLKGPAFIGIDVSSQMIELAMKNGGYTSCHCADLKECLETFASSTKESNELAMNLIVAADTFLYVGQLGEVFALAHQTLCCGGLFLFSTEDLDASPMKKSEQVPVPRTTYLEEVCGYEDLKYIHGVQMLTSARFAHSHRYIMNLVERFGFNLVEMRDIVVRTEVSVPLPGKIYLLEKT